MIYFFCFFPTHPPTPHHFSNGPSLMGIFVVVRLILLEIQFGKLFLWFCQKNWPVILESFCIYSPCYGQCINRGLEASMAFVCRWARSHENHRCFWQDVCQSTVTARGKNISYNLSPRYIVFCKQLIFLFLSCHVRQAKVKLFLLESAPTLSESETAIQSFQLNPILNNWEINRYRFRQSNTCPIFGRVSNFHRDL